MCKNNFFVSYAALWWKSMIFIVLSSLETVHDTVQYRYCNLSLLYRFIVLLSLETVHDTVQYRYCNLSLLYRFTVLSSLETVHDTVQYRYCKDTVQYRYCNISLLYRFLRIRLKCQNPILSYVREREKERRRERKHTVNVQLVYRNFIIILFNGGDVFICVI